MKVEYIDHMGSDLTVTNSARVSFDKESVWEQVGCGCIGYHPDYCDGSCIFPDNKLSEKDQKLITYLAKHNHFTPFTHAVITVRETVPIFVARQRFKHTVGFTYNEVSRRYVDDTPEFFTPDVWRSRPEGSVKQGSGDGVVEYFEYPGDVEYGEPEITRIKVAEEYHYFLLDAERLYNKMLESGVAPEQARMVLPQSMYTSYYVTGSLAAFARAYKLRSDPHSQKETQDVAIEWDEIIRPLFPISWAALVD